MQCIVRHCKNVWMPISNVKFHSFPKQPERRILWLSNIPLKGKFYESARICSVHFKPEDYDPRRPSHLTKDAMPFYLTQSCDCGNKVCSREQCAYTFQKNVSAFSEHCSPASSGIRPAIKRKKSSLRSTKTDKDNSDDSRSGDESDGLCDDDDFSESSQQTSLAKKTDIGRDRLQTGCHCNGCNNVITGFRYLCVQCKGIELCGACESAGLHELHYVLRVPRRRPSEEIASVLEKIREELFKHENTIESIEIEIKEEPDQMGVVEKINIYTTEPTDNQTMKVKSRRKITTDDAVYQIAPDIPNKRMRLEMEEFLNFKHQNATSHVTTQLSSVVPNSNDIAYSLPDIKDIKVEAEVIEEARCDVFVHTDVDPSSSKSTTMKPGLSEPGNDQRTTILRQGMGLSETTASVTSNMIITAARSLGSTGPLETATMAPQLLPHGAAPEAQLSRAAAKPGRYLVKVTGCDTGRNEKNFSGAQ